MFPSAKFGCVRGFTLIELLVVIAIIAILASIAFPFFGRMRDNSQKAGCLSNLRQIGAAVMQYAGDNNGELPANRTPSGVYAEFLAPYLGKPADGRLKSKVFLCPAAKAKQPTWSNVIGYEPDYGANDRRNSIASGTPGVFSRQDPGWGAVVPAVKLAMINKPSRCLMISDACITSDVRTGSWQLEMNNLTSTPPSSAVPNSKLGPRHGYDGTNSLSGGFSALFCDGHVEMILYKDQRLSDPTLRRELLVPF